MYKILMDTLMVVLQPAFIRSITSPIRNVDCFGLYRMRIRLWDIQSDTAQIS